MSSCFVKLIFVGIIDQWW